MRGRAYIRWALRIGLILAVCVATAYVLKRLCADPGPDAAQLFGSLAEDGVVRVTVVFHDLDRRQPAAPENSVTLDVSDVKTRIVHCLQTSRFSSKHCHCRDIGAFVLETKDGGVVKIGFSGHRLMVQEPRLRTSKVFHSQPLDLFVLALPFDASARVFSKEGVENVLLPLARKGHLGALSELARLGSPKAVSVLPQALRVAGGGQEEKLSMVLSSLERVGKVDDKEAIAIVTRFIRHEDVNVVWRAADALESWGQMEHLRRLSRSEKHAGTSLACWFALNKYISDAILTARTMGVENFDLIQYSRFFEALDGTSPGPERKVTPDERRETYLLLADMIEAQQKHVFLVLLTDLWERMGVEYDFNKGRLVTRGRSSHCPEVLQEMRRQAPKIAAAIREWARNKWPTKPQPARAADDESG